MDYMIFDSAGNAVDAFASDGEAIAALLAMVREDQDAARHLAILTFDDNGEAVGEPITVADVLPELATVVNMAGQWIRYNALTFISSWQIVGGAATQRMLTTGAPPPEPAAH